MHISNIVRTLSLLFKLSIVSKPAGSLLTQTGWIREYRMIYGGPGLPPYVLAPRPPTTPPSSFSKFFLFSVFLCVAGLELKPYFDSPRLDLTVFGLRPNKSKTIRQKNLKKIKFYHVGLVNILLNSHKAEKLTIS